MRLLLLLLLTFAIAIASAEFLDVDCGGLEKACCDGESLPGAERAPGDIGADAKTGCTTFGGKKKECGERGNLACCGALHGTIGTQCEGVEDGQITCAKQALSYRKHKRWSLPLKRALFQKRGDWCDQRGATQQFQDFNEKNPPKPIDNDVGFPAINTAPVGGAVQLFQDLSKSNDKGTKSDPGSTTFDTAPVDFAPVLPADGLFDYSSESDPYFQQNY